MNSVDLRKNNLNVFSTIKPFVFANWRLFAIGWILALMVVGIRIAFPWPLKVILHQWVGKSGSTPDSSSWFGGGNVTVVNAVVFFLLVVSLGWADYWERWFFARFSINIAHDLRLRAVDSAVAVRRRQLNGVGTGELVSRLIGDLARFKAGLKGFLVHVATNGMLLIGVIVVLFMVSFQVGLVMAAAGLAIFGATMWGAWATYQRASRYRQKEGHLAESIQHATADQHSGSSDFSTGSRESGNHEAALTQIQGRTTWFSHAAFGIGVVVCLILGSREVQAGTLDPGDVVVFVLYAMMLRAPMVQLSRQGARTGKIVACLVRINDIICNGETEDASEAEMEITSLSQTLELNEVVVRAGGIGKRLAGPISLKINAGERVLVLGERGSGKTSLLRAIRGSLAPVEGCILWDGRDFSQLSNATRLSAVAMMSDSARWIRQRIGGLVDPTAGHSTEEVCGLIERLGGKRIVRRLKRGLDTKLGSNQLSSNERKTIIVARLLLTGPSVLLFDQPHSGMSRKHSRQILRAITNDAQHRTVIVTSTVARSLSQFDRIIHLRSGRCIFDGSPEVWRDQSDSAVSGSVSKRVGV